jgi:transcriptional regulator with XRE-family HTH domain
MTYVDEDRDVYEEVRALLLPHVGARLREHRERLGLSQRDVADMTGMPRPNLCRLEQGRHLPHLATICRVARVLDVRPTELLAPLDGYAAGLEVDP